MDKDKAIQEINNTKQKVNEGSRAFRDQIDFTVLPLVEEDAVVTGLIHEARDAWTSADRVAKSWLEQAKTRILKPANTNLSGDLHWDKLGKMFSAFFFIGGLTLKPGLPGYSDKGYREVIDKIADEDLSNVIRMIGMSNFNETDWGEEHLAPHPRDKNGIFDLHTINREWEDQTKWRLDHAVNKGLTVRYIFNDQCSITGWHKHWLRQTNNHGWNGQKTYPDRYGWVHWTGLSDPNYGNKDERAWYKATGEYIRFMRDYIFHNYLEQYGKYIIWDNNEIEAGAGWHHQEADFLNDHKVWKENRITSVSGFEWFHTKNSIPSRWMIEDHGIDTVDAYNEQCAFFESSYTDEHGNNHKPVKGPWLPCADGKAKWIDVGPVEIAKILRLSINDGNLGFMGNSEGRWNSMNPKIYKVAEAMRDEVLRK